MNTFLVGYLLGPYIFTHGYLAWCLYRITRWNGPETGLPGVTFQAFVLRTSMIACPLLFLEIVPMLLWGNALAENHLGLLFPGTALKAFLAIGPLTFLPPIPEHLRAPRRNNDLSASGSVPPVLDDHEPGAGD